MKIIGIEDSVNLYDDQPDLVFGLEVNGKPLEGGIPPFYVSLNIHDKILHNAMIESGTSHNLMPKVIMERMGLETTRPYKDFFSFDSKRVRCIGLIKDVFVGITQVPTKTVVMEIVLADIPPKFGML